MKIYYLGTCAGTEPVPDRHHQSFALETDDGSVYWFDAGENCSYTAHLKGVDLLNVRAVFISHTHMDHVGGLGNLFWNIRKMGNVKGVANRYREIDLHIPTLETWEGIWMILKNTEGHFNASFQIVPHRIAEDGVVYADDNITVEAMKNSHFKDGSYSFKITAGGKTVVYSGDIGGYEELEPLIKDGCDYLLIETGHHGPDSICRYLKESGYTTAHLRYIHNGSAIRNNEKGAHEAVKAIYDGEYAFCFDGMVEEL